MTYPVRIEIQLEDGKYQFLPLKTITAYESTKIFQYLMVAMFAGVSQEDRIKYFYDNDLIKHFVRL